jgi:hypothetical protein
MASANLLFRPYHLELGEQYLLRDTALDATAAKHIEVTFVGYDNCPWFVYVRNREGYVGRFPRSDLYQCAIVSQSIAQV